MVASVKSYKDNLKLQLANMSSDLAKTTCSDDTTSHHLAENDFWQLFHPLSLKMNYIKSAVNRAHKVLNRGAYHFSLQLFDNIHLLLYPPSEVNSCGGVCHRSVVRVPITLRIV